MTERRQIYKCNVCGIVAEVLDGGAGQIICCGQPMQLMTARSDDSAKEKHVPHVEIVPGGVLVRVGRNEEHPMLDKHWIQWIEVVIDGAQHRQFLNPGQKPEAFFPVAGEEVAAREYCNLHGLWKG